MRAPTTGQSSRDYQSAMSARMTEQATMKQPMTKRELLQLNHISIEHMKSRVGDKMNSVHLYNNMAQRRAQTTKGMANRLKCRSEIGVESSLQD